MPLNTSASTTLVAALKAGKEYAEIFTSCEDWALFCSDFMLLTRVCVAERAGDNFDNAGRDAVKNNSLNRDVTKKYDAKAQANGRPTLLMLAMEESKSKTQAGFDRELKEAGILTLDGLKQAYEEFA